MIGNVLRFRIKKTLVGVAALSLLVPMASHADVTPGKWIFDGFSRSTRDGKGATCVGSGGDTHAFDVPNCTDASASEKTAAEASAKARKAAQEVVAAKKAAAAAEAKEFMPGGQTDFRVRRNDGIRVLDGFGRECVKNGSPVAGSTGNCADPTPQSARGVDSVIAARAAAKKEAQAASASAAAAAAALPMVPGGALADGQKGAYVYHPAGSTVRDGYGRSCVKDGLWHPALATEDCHADLYNQWQAKAARPEPELIQRVEMPPPEAQRAAEAAAVPPSVESVPAPAPAPAESLAKAAVADEAPAEFPITKYAIDGDVAEAATLPTVAALAADVENDADDEDDDVVAESDETSDDSEDAPVAMATPQAADAVDAAPVAFAAVDDDDVEDDGNVPDEPDDDDDDTMPFLAGDMRDEDDATLAAQDDGSADGDDDALLDEDDAPVATFAAAEDDDSSDDAGDDIAANDDAEEDDTDAVYLADADPAANADDTTAVAMVADDDDDEDTDASDDDDDDTDAVFLGDADKVADAGEAPTLAMVAEEDDDEGDDVVFATDDDDDEAPPAFAAEEPAVANAATAPVAVVAAAEAPKAAPAPVENKQVEFPVTRYEVERSAPATTKAPEPASAPAVAPAANTECPPTTIQMEEGRFAFDRYTLRPAVVAKLDAIAELLKTAKCDAIMITGHTDRIGSSKYNQRLSERRAAAAKNYLVTRKGIDQSLVSIAGVGKTEPVTAAADCKGKRKKALIACYAPDRRVVITATTRRN